MAPEGRRCGAVWRACRGAAAAALLLVGLGCDAREWNLRRYDREIQRSAQAVASAKSDAERAAAHDRRARAYSERARYARAFKITSAEEYGRLFDLAVADHAKAIALAPADAALYLGRGRTSFDRATLEEAAEARKTWYGSAEADFTRAIERSPRSAEAFDMRGLVYSVWNDHERAIADFTAEMKLEPRLGKLRLYEAYCQRGSEHQKAGRHGEAITDYESATALRSPGDSCDCQAETPLAWEYLEKKDYDRSWQVVRQARSDGRWIAPELLERLKKESGRDR